MKVSFFSFFFFTSEEINFSFLALKALKFGIIPSGTGNGLSASLGHGRDITNAVESIIKGSVSQVDLLEIKDYKTNEHITYGALAVSWGFVSGFFLFHFFFFYFLLFSPISWNFMIQLFN